MPSGFGRKIKRLFRLEGRKDVQGSTTRLPSPTRSEVVAPTLIVTHPHSATTFDTANHENLAFTPQGRLDEPHCQHGSPTAPRSPGLLPTPAHSHRRTGTPTPPPATASGPSYLSNAHDFAVSNLTINNTSTTAEPKTVFDYLNPHISRGAAHDSDERCDAPACHRETRAAVLEDIVGWIRHGDGGKKPREIMWLSGPAGAGKTAIAGSAAEACQEEGLLAASFFFSSFMGSEESAPKRP